MNNIAKTYKEKYNLIPITGNIIIKNSKKTFDRASYKHINQENCLTEINDTHNCISIIPKHNNLVVLDTDNLVDWENFKKEFNIQEPNTVKEQTKKGNHYYFKINQEQKNIITKNITKIKNYNIDIIYNTLIFMTPSKYIQNGKEFKYAWCNGFELCKKEFEQVPEWILNLYENEKIPDKIFENDYINTKIKQILSENKLKELIMGLDKSRSDNRDDWIRVGYFLSTYNCGNSIFKEFSKQSDKYDEARFKIDWESFKDGEKDINIGTILKWLKDDNLTLYNNFIEENKILKEINEITKEFGIKHNEIVKRNKKEIIASHDPELKTIKVFHDMQSKNCKNPDLRSICTKNGVFAHCTKCNFQYPEKSISIDKINAPTIYNTLIVNNNITEDINNKDTTQVVKIIKEKFENRIIYNNGIWYLYNIISGIYEKKAEEIIRLEIDKLVNEMKEVEENNEDWINWMQKIGYKDNIIKELKIYCYNEEKLDDREYLLGFENGVYDLEKNIFRKAEKEEYITMKCNTSYEENYDTTLAENVLKTTFTNNEERLYAIYRFALCLEGYNNEQTLTFNYGYTASNGKSFLMERLKTIFGDYGEIFPVNFITSKMKNAGESNSTLINFKNKRFMFCSEPESGCKLNVNAVKSLTGDIVKARGLYEKNEIEIKPTYHIFMCCNVLPPLDSEDEGIIRRIRILEYNTKFVDNPKKKNELQIIKYSKNDIKIIEEGLLYILIKYYTELKNNNFIYTEPSNLTAIKNIYVNVYKDEINTLLLENYKICENSFVKLKDIKTLLKNNNIKEKDNITLKYMIENIFNGEVEFFNRKKFDYTDYLNIFTNLKEV